MLIGALYEQFPMFASLSINEQLSFTQKLIHLTQNSTTDMVICRNRELEECLDHF
jgi:hypothetical protein